MRRGTTPVHVFDTDIDLTSAKVYITYAQGDDVIVEKTNEDMEITESSISVQLSQEETLKFAAGPVKIQIRYIMEDGTADASNIMTGSVNAILKDGVI